MTDILMSDESDTQKTIYKKSHEYRLHTDNVRWTLLGGYAVFLAAAFGLTPKDKGLIHLNDATFAFLLFVASFAYLWILAVQNWFYNLFARFADECESRLISGLKMRSLQDFAVAKGSTITPFHPAFFFAELIVTSFAYYFLYLSLTNLYLPGVSEFIHCLPTAPVKWFPWAGLVLYFWILNYLFKHWDSIVFKRFIEPFSNLYKTSPQIEGVPEARK